MIKGNTGWAGEYTSSLIHIVISVYILLILLDRLLTIYLVEYIYLCR